MHRLLFAFAAFALAAGCSHPKPTGPKWPEPSATDEDGGESIEPHASATYAAAAIEKSEDTPAAAPAPEASSAADATSDDKPASTPAVSEPTVEDEVLTTEEIIIEIEE